ncbi:fasciclin domain-containing protein [Hymenobacter weizhouensis]|uniref:fasciclin domain-containing protein n=1 Tax=Hymenobacter sp. YIM 151500-1 TaxID=2987689 RepID=UPI002226CD7C|nr:fasciclin domain-containing protein [Hymenobacter sp. YIM 151500-1]UYZ64356.1 fasciclin domain-containing protein [Hymenobacter sp. YIM 151500-1]
MKNTFSSTWLLALAAGSALGLGSCGGNDTATTETTATAATTATIDSAALLSDSARMGKPQGVQVGGVAMLPDKTIVQNAVQAPSLSTLVQAVRAAGLDATLSEEGPYTVFAPSNAAFDQLPNGALAGLLKPESKDKLRGVLTYHVIQSRLVAQDLRDGQQLTTVNGEKISVTVENGKVKINGATIETPDVVSRNGIVHVIDNVLLPPAGE